jgi:hypothetical protein
MSKSQLARKKAEKRKVGMGRRVKPVRRRAWEDVSFAEGDLLDCTARDVLHRTRCDPGHHVCDPKYYLRQF